MDAPRFKIVFEKLAAHAAKADRREDDLYHAVESLRSEMEGIEELRRLSLEISEPEPASYTTT
jgi:hypothetical protein